MRPALAAVFAALLAACAPAPPPPAAAERSAANPADPIERAKAVDPAVRAAKDRQDAELERQGG
jgi:hypothetical protein